MIISSTDEVAGKRIVKTLGLVKGSTIRARHLGKDILALLKNILGGEIEEYTKLMAESREQAMDRMSESAGERGRERNPGSPFLNELCNGQCRRDTRVRYRRCCRIK